MKRFILVRHAKSCWDDPMLNDYSRPLNERGEKNAPEMAERFGMLNLTPDLILSSGATRAHQTAEIFAAKLSWKESQIQLDNQLYHASASTIKQIIKTQPEALKTIIIFGHNPGFTDFANLIGSLQIENLPTCGIYGITLKSSWKQIGQERAEVFYYDFPKKKF